MKKSISVVRMLALAVLFLQTSAIAHDSKELCHFMPKNDLYIPAGLESYSGGIDEQTFNNVIDKISKVYEPIIKARGGNLKVNRLWTDGTVNASAQRQGSTYLLNMYGGLARHSRTTEDGFALVMCHELGHHLGGFPTTGGLLGLNNWASNEGQSDYFATMKCFRRVYENEDNAAVISKLAVPQAVKDKCSSSFKSNTEINLCVRGSMAGKILADLLWSLANGQKELTGSKMPDFETPNPKVVSKTDNAHPEAQCRLDTYLAGAICQSPYTEDFGKKDPISGACAQEKGDRFGFRPLCWYKPQN